MTWSDTVLPGNPLSDEVVKMDTTESGSDIDGMIIYGVI